MLEQTAQPITTERRRRHHQLLNDENVRRWYNNLKRASELTADVRIRRLGLFCEELKISPLSLIEKDPHIITDILDDTITRMEEKGYAPGYIQSTIVAMKSWLAHFGIKTTRKLRIKNANIPVTLQNEKVPDSEELSQMLLLGSLKQRVLKQLIAKAGVRPQTMGNYSGTDGLTIRDLPDLAITSSGVRFLQHPAMLIVRPPLSKARHQYSTFLTMSAMQTLQAYLNQQIEKGRTLGPGTPLIPAEPTGFLTTKSVSHYIRISIRPKFTNRPYLFRAFFDTQLLVAESKGKIAHDFRVFWMGHKGSMEARYTTNKQRLPESLISEMRDAFKRAEPYLDLERFAVDETEKQRQEAINKITQLNPDTLGQVLELIRRIG